ncbi:HLA class II histocompatibility antigen, DQ beta 2 chain-like [Sphaeramia orbicularis]|uniref:HLA class II histocompatibility antigen, DQ beta 2 chain-like n=1 Tax=Sphaeramia orbicularis TaxID=375764 RepID=A0A673ARQ5_9TELE|nr:HLA class II histocompatibility antigen, DQ beta 2 chain-like [Sphaeramia orbicularis]XP_030014740.1 HLA class II histocompatibility antigen, DQ beta 2 chain-like [Sphaeramia orbicularis]
MAQTLCFITFLLLPLLFSRANALYGALFIRCQFTSPGDYDSVCLEQYYFSQMLIGQYNSTLGKVINYREETQKIVDDLNNNPGFLSHQAWIAGVCRIKSKVVHNSLQKPVEPYIRLTSVKDPESEHPAMLRCSVYNFYPKQIRVTWLRNEKEVTSDVTSTEELSNGNWLYQIHSYLEYTPTFGEKITCMVEHASFMEPKCYDWDPMTESEKNKIAVGTAGLLLGLMFSVVGLIYYKKSPIGRVLVPTT